MPTSSNAKPAHLLLLLLGASLSLSRSALNTELLITGWALISTACFLESWHLEPVPGDECLSPASEQRCVEEQLACSDAAPCCVSLTLLLSDMQETQTLCTTAALSLPFAFRFAARCTSDVRRAPVPQPALLRTNTSTPASEQLLLVTGCTAYARVRYQPLPAQLLLGSQSGSHLPAADGITQAAGADADVAQLIPTSSSRLWPRVELSVMAMLAAIVLLHGFLVAALRRQSVAAPSEVFRGPLQAPASRSAAASSVMRSRCTQVHYAVPTLVPPTRLAEPCPLPVGSQDTPVISREVKVEPASSLDISLGTLSTEELVTGMPAQQTPGPEKSSRQASELIRSSMQQPDNDSPWQRHPHGGRLTRQKSSSLLQ